MQFLELMEQEKFWEKPDYVPNITVVGSDESEVRKTFNNTLASESLKRGWQ